MFSRARRRWPNRTTIDGGEERELTAPWKVQDVVLRLLLTR